MNRINIQGHPKRRVFFSFHFAGDAWRAAQIRNAGLVEDDEPISDNAWEQVKRGGDAAIKRWIDSQMATRSCVVVLIGTRTANRKWVNYEIRKGWESGKGLVGVYIHGLKDRFGQNSTPGRNPFAGFKIDTMPLTKIVRSYNSPYPDSQGAYRYITQNIAGWVEEAIAIRSRWR